MNAPAGPFAVLDARAIAATAASIEKVQLASGLIPWHEGGPADPWNHVEAAMALDTAGHHERARAAYRFLERAQRADGSFPASLLPEAASPESHVDTNAVAYLASGLFHHSLSSRDPSVAARSFGLVEAAIDYVLAQQRNDGAIAWSVGPGADDSALLAASSAIYLSLGAALGLAGLLRVKRRSWAVAREQLRRAVTGGVAPFLDKAEFAMDWYYPVLSGALGQCAGRQRLLDGKAAFVVADGVRCRSDRRWVTTAETAECAIASLRVGDVALARALFSSLSDKRRESGGYLTGLVYPERSEFPAGEETSYSAAAVLLAADALAGGTATSTLFATGRTSTRRLPLPAPRSSTNAPVEIASR